jgi:hypothetical protein
VVTVRQGADRLTIRQFPVELYILTALFTLPLFYSALSNLLYSREADSPYCVLLLALALTWFLLDVAALREEIVVDRTSKILTRTVRGLLRHQKQQIALEGMLSLRLELKPDQYGTPYRYLYLLDAGESHLINNPYLIRNEHQRVGELISEFLNLPFSMSP